MFERLSEWISATSFAMRRVRLDDMVGGVVKMSLWQAGCRWNCTEGRWLRVGQGYCSDLPEGCFVLSHLKTMLPCYEKASLCDRCRRWGVGMGKEMV